MKNPNRHIPQFFTPAQCQALKEEGWAISQSYSVALKSVDGDITYLYPDDDKFKKKV